MCVDPLAAGAVGHVLLAESRDLAALTKTIRDRLKRQGKAVADFDRAVAKIYKAVTDGLLRDLDAMPPGVRQGLANISAESLEQLLDAAGLSDLRVEFSGAQLDLIDQANAAVAKGGLPAGQIAPNSSAVRAFLQVEGEALWADRVRSPAVQTIRRGLRAAAQGRSSTDLIPVIEKELGVVRSTARTEARTQIAEFDRTVTAAAAQESGANFYLYRGPDDALTRPFCQELVGKVFTLDEIELMANAQTAASPLFAGGGYNCRHSWLPVSDGFIERNEIPVGTMGDVKTANLRARSAR